MKLKYEGAFLIAQIHRIAGRVFSRMLKDAGMESITPAQGRILFPLWRRDNMPIVELARETSLSKSTLTHMLDTLEESGNIARVPSTGDRREILVRLTDRDIVRRNDYLRISQAMADAAYRGISENERAAFERTLRTVLDNLKNHEAVLSREV